MHLWSINTRAPIDRAGPPFWQCQHKWEWRQEWPWTKRTFLAQESNNLAPANATRPANGSCGHRGKKQTLTSSCKSWTQPSGASVHSCKTNGPSILDFYARSMLMTGFGQINSLQKNVGNSLFHRTESAPAANFLMAGCEFHRCTKKGSHLVQ